MASSEWIATVPDSSREYRFPKTMEIEEVRASLINITGAVALSSAQYTVNGDRVAFTRVAGGTKGL